MAKNILICDDAAFMRMMIKDILSKNGYNVAGEAENGARAVEKYNELKPDLVLMDITMPEMDGIQALKKIKEGDPSALVIMCSAMGQQAMVIESIQAGAKDFIVKPFQADRVIEAVKKVVGQSMTILILSSRAEGFAQFITAILIFVFVLALTCFTTRFVGKFQQVRGYRNFESIESFRITNGKYLQLVRVGSKYIVIGIGKDSVTKICEVSEEDVKLLSEQQQMPDAFKDLIDKARMRVGKRDDSHDE